MYSHKSTNSNEKLIIDGNSLYELDLDCLKKKQKEKEKDNKDKTKNMNNKK